MKNKHNEPAVYPQFTILNFGKNYIVTETNKKIYKDGNIITDYTAHESYLDKDAAVGYAAVLLEYQKNLA